VKGEGDLFEDSPRSGTVGGVGGAMIKIVKEKVGAFNAFNPKIRLVLELAVANSGNYMTHG